MATKKDLEDWILDALKDLGGTAAVIDVSRKVWEKHESELAESGDLFFTWQYDLRWAAQRLRDNGTLRSFGNGKRGNWAIA